MNWNWRGALRAQFLARRVPSSRMKCPAPPPNQSRRPISPSSPPRKPVRPTKSLIATARRSKHCRNRRNRRPIDFNGSHNGRSRLRPAMAIAIYAVGVVVLSALVAPWAFILVHPHLPKVPFHRVFDRVLLVVSLTGLWPLLRALGLRSWRELGFPRVDTWWRNAVTGYAVGIASFVAAGALLIALGERSFDADLSAGALVIQVLKFAATGIVVAIVEETFFRGGVQSALQRGFGTITALIVTSAIYSAVHFLKPKGGASDLAIWSSG